VTENICLGREKRRFGLLDWGAMHEEARALLARFDVHVDVRRPVMTYPTAVQQMVAIARAIGFNARLVVMDEPTSSLDEREVGVLFDVIRGLRDSGVSVIFVSHKLDELYAVCDRVTIMRDGRTVRVGPMAEVSRLDLVTTMLGRELERVLHDDVRGGPARDGAASVLDVRGLSAGMRVRDVSFDVREGEIVGLAGLLGAGRTESARVVFGADPMSGGSVRVSGREGAPATPGDAIRAGLGFVSEDRKLEGIVPGLSVRENLTLALKPQLTRGRRGGTRARARAIVERFNQRVYRTLQVREPRAADPPNSRAANPQQVSAARCCCMNPRLPDPRRADPSAAMWATGPRSLGLVRVS
jgi:ribose transport system ATP-binding protein